MTIVTAGRQIVPLRAELSAATAALTQIAINHLNSNNLTRPIKPCLPESIRSSAAAAPNKPPTWLAVTAMPSLANSNPHSAAPLSRF
jgi:hypothetical protein